MAGFLGQSEKLKRDGNRNSFVVLEDKDLVRRKRGKKKRTVVINCHSGFNLTNAIATQ